MNHDFNERTNVGTLLSASISFNSENHVSAIRNQLAVKHKNMFFFNYGRNALKAIIERVSKRGDKLVFQAFICPWLIAEAARMGRVPVLVDSCLDSFNVDVRFLAEKQKDSKMTFVAHNFGVPADIIQVRKACQSHLVEDMAHSMFANLNGMPLGSFGDSVLYSMYKQIPNFHGSVLFSNLEIAEPTVRESLGLEELKRIMVRVEGAHQPLFDFFRSRSNPKYAFETYETKRPSRTAISLFARLLGEVKARVAKKARVAEMYYSSVRSSDKFVPQVIDSGANPSWFSFNIRLAEEIAYARDAIVSDLRKAGIYCDKQWFDAPVGIYAIRGSIAEHCDNAVLLSKSIINLPLKHHFSSDVVYYILNNLRVAIERACKI